MTNEEVVETSVTVNNSPINPDDYTQPTYEMTPRFNPFSRFVMLYKLVLTFESQSRVENQESLIESK